jgi:excisionase family DNA binding protein
LRENGYRCPSGLAELERLLADVVTVGQARTRADNEEMSGRESLHDEPDDRHEVLLTVNEAAYRLGVSERTVRRWIQAGELPALRLGSTVRIPATALDAKERNA